MTERPPSPATSAPEKAPLPFPGFWQGVGLAVLPSAFGCLAGIPILILRATKAMANPEALLPLAQVLCFLPVLWLGYRLARRPWREVFPFGPFPWGLLPAFLLTQASLTLLVAGVDALWGRVLPEPRSLGEMIKSMGPLTLVLVAPLTEEPLCRGLVLGGLRARYPKGRAILLSALVFALMHLNPWQFFPPLMIGLLYGWIALETGSLWLPILGHLLHNGAYALALKRPIPYLSDDRLLPLWLWLGALALGLLGAAGLGRTFARKAAPEA